jgi:hypothetical protein
MNGTRKVEIPSGFSLGALSDLAFLANASFGGAMMIMSAAAIANGNSPFLFMVTS